MHSEQFVLELRGKAYALPPEKTIILFVLKSRCYDRGILLINIEIEVFQSSLHVN